MSYTNRMTCSIGRNTPKYKGAAGSSTLQEVTENGNVTSLSIETTASFLGDGSLLTGIATNNEFTVFAERVEDLENAVVISNSSGITSGFLKGDLLYASDDNTLSKLPHGATDTVLTVSQPGELSWQPPPAVVVGNRLDNLEESNELAFSILYASESNIANLQTSNVLIWDLARKTESNVKNLQTSNVLIWDLARKTESNVKNLQTSNVLIWDLARKTESNVKNLQTSNVLIWDLARKTESNVKNLQTSNELIWDVVFDTNANVTNLQTSNELIWDVVFDTNANVVNLQTSNELIWDAMFDTNANVANLQTSNELIWDAVFDTNANVTNLQTSNELIWDAVFDTNANVANLQTSNELIWDAVFDTNANVVNLQTSNELIWDAVFDTTANVSNLQTSNELIWDAVFDTNANVANLQTSNELIWDAVFDTTANVANLQTSNELIWDVVYDTNANVANLQTSNELIWSRLLDNVNRIETIEDNVILSDSYGITSGFSRGDMIIASADNFLAKLNLGATGKVLRSSGQVPYWDDIQVTTTIANNYLVGTLSWVQRGTDIDGTMTNSKTGTSVSLSSSGNTMVVNKPGIGEVEIYVWSSGTWGLAKGISGKNSRTVSISGDGNVVAIGDPGSFSVYIYKLINGSWGEDATLIGPQSGGQFGWSVDLSTDGTRIVVGDPFTETDTDPGNVYVYENTSDSWGALGTHITGSAEELHGYSVAISGDGNTIALSAILNNTSYYKAGYVKVYTYSEGSWQIMGNILYGSDVGERFGYAIDLSSDGNILAVGTPYNDKNGGESGQVKVYTWNSVNWIQRGLDINGSTVGDFFGNSVALSDDGSNIIIGALYNDELFNDGGQVKVFQWTGTIWSQLGYNVNGEGASDFSGTSVDISSSGNVIIVGAPHNGTSSQGHVRAFVLENITPVSEFDPTPINTRIDGIDVDIVNINNQIGTNSNKIIVLENGFNTLDSRVDGINDRLTVSESTIGSLVTTTTNLSGRMTSAESTIGSLVTTTTNLSGRMTSAESTIGSLVTTTTGLLSDVSDNDTRITTLEQNPLTIAGAGLPSSFVPGDLLYASGVNSLSTIPIGTNGQVLKTNGTGYFWSDDITGGGDTGVGNLQAVTDVGAATNRTVYFQNAGDSIIASGSIQAVNFRGDGGLLSNLPTRPNLQEVTDKGDATTNKTITLTNTGDSLIASGKITLTNTGDSLLASGKITAPSLSVGGQSITSGTITDNVQRINNLETSNTLIWDLARKTESNVTNLQTSNELIWDVVFDTNANVTNLQTSNELIWDAVFDTNANVTNLQTSNELIWDEVFYMKSNVTNLQISNGLTWSNVQDLKSNTLIRTSGSIVSLNTGDILYAENADTLKTLPLGAEGTVLTASASGLPSWGAIPGIQGSANYTEIGGNTGISNTQPGTTLSVGSNLYIQDTGQDILYVNGNVYIRHDLVVVGTLTVSAIRCQRSFVNRTVVVSERPIYTGVVQVSPN